MPPHRAFPALGEYDDDPNNEDEQRNNPHLMETENRGSNRRKKGIPSWSEQAAEVAEPFRHQETLDEANNTQSAENVGAPQAKLLEFTSHAEFSLASEDSMLERANVWQVYNAPANPLIPKDHSTGGYTLLLSAVRVIKSEALIPRSQHEVSS